MLKSDLERTIYDTHTKIDKGVKVKEGLEQAIFEINQKLDGGVKVYISDQRRGDAIVNGLIGAVIFAIGSIIITEIRNAWVRWRNKRFYDKMRGE